MALSWWSVAQETATCLITKNVLYTVPTSSALSFTDTLLSSIGPNFRLLTSFNFSNFRGHQKEVCFGHSLSATHMLIVFFPRGKSHIWARSVQFRHKSPERVKLQFSLCFGVLFPVPFLVWSLDRVPKLYQRKFKCKNTNPHKKRIVC